VQPRSYDDQTGPAEDAPGLVIGIPVMKWSSQTPSMPGGEPDCRGSNEKVKEKALRQSGN
jgi:hypothetical protein